MTVFRQDVLTLSSGPTPGGVPLSVEQADRVVAVLNDVPVQRTAAGDSAFDALQDTGKQAGAPPRIADRSASASPGRRARG